ncbi:hypothetical protein IAQ61_008410 [Plenodomus lingam]|uniref:Predicted protein n=1 Tax=Leptosphaeria maculans (strain JN3 / isolate v23.1.3 / race Av1-4-5-6-7-8) TaxID=985895 RepID=E4ZU90_LEPMJ|nr:predicted protein [Plenodomus lingam JN3]KAH9866405.1 hypothetical protein IAQ61_008410 [Plenodomus lingam]CBX94969.1 predicted protein [Plenodomus lingam JN3]
MRLSIRHLNSHAGPLHLTRLRTTNGKCGTAVLATYWTASLLLDQFTRIQLSVTPYGPGKAPGVAYLRRPRFLGEDPVSLEARPIRQIKLAQHFVSGQHMSTDR